MPKESKNCGIIKTILLQKILKAIKKQTVNNNKNERNNRETLTAAADINCQRNDDDPRSRMDVEQQLCRVKASQPYGFFDCFRCGDILSLSS
ncbi:hypothetical protein M9H77_16748 [Catharanthus roseus]|uniref:Uncharacterized protein n=1 Tax=Catharanthus roseus TaxID=4058 RepID=A0ACC0B2L8_CATRO|nr:hypothetical protein M9H77_16748 [Catharanthus roseus]